MELYGFGEKSESTGVDENWFQREATQKWDNKPTDGGEINVFPTSGKPYRKLPAFLETNQQLFNHIILKIANILVKFNSTSSINLKFCNFENMQSKTEFIKSCLYTSSDTSKLPPQFNTQHN